MKETLIWPFSFDSWPNPNKQIKNKSVADFLLTHFNVSFVNKVVAFCTTDICDTFWCRHTQKEKESCCVTLKLLLSRFSKSSPPAKMASTFFSPLLISSLDLVLKLWTSSASFLANLLLSFSHKQPLFRGRDLGRSAQKIANNTIWAFSTTIIVDS